MSDALYAPPTDQAEKTLLGLLHRVLEAPDSAGRPPSGAAVLTSPRGEQVEVPAVLYGIVHEAVEKLASGRPVRIVPSSELLTTGEAAAILNVSRPYLVKILDAGRLPSTKVGTHRRVLSDDILAFKEERDAERQAVVRGMIARYRSVDRVRA